MAERDREEANAVIARNVAALLDELCRGPMTVNLGAGIPLLTANYLHNDRIFIHTENGMVGVGPLAYGDEVHPDLVNAGRQPVRETPGCAYTDVAESFGMIRGGHIDAAVLGAFQVDQEGSIANWIVPGGTQLGVGGAMDLVAGAKTVVAAMTHTNRGASKLVRRCTLPVTGYGEVDYAVTELGVFSFAPGGPVLEKIYPGCSPEDVRRVTEFPFTVSETLREMLP